ncbi:PiggyBac transposable element-derived protein 3 [Acipenser ruthenus]|uniref:PiggyBac transposable element-derived protein 3 n=1 Tax=Acipenser ruthenus TaxID=7906 RepID=A0A444UQ83_ACIRT|nr:PiggyBac transposable element-derived protein 3 [Acipenser ruthenus]
MYWDSSTNIDFFKGTLPCYRFFQLYSNLHVVNNHERPAGNTDVFFKVRPLCDCIRKCCLELPLEEDLCINEQVVPFKGTLSVKQYCKPNPWGVKICFLCGLVCDFLLYQGATTELSEESKKRMGHGAAVVLHLSQRISDPNHKLYFDNYFTTYNVIEVLTDKRIHAAETARICRFANPPLKSDKEMSKKERGNNPDINYPVCYREVVAAWIFFGLAWLSLVINSCIEILEKTSEYFNQRQLNTLENKTIEETVEEPAPAEPGEEISESKEEPTAPECS